MQRLALEEAQHDIEYKASRFWQIYLQGAFPQHENFAVVCEQAADQRDSRKRVDITVLRYDPAHHTFSAMLFTEAKHQGTAEIKAVEKQALRAANEAIDAFSLRAVYAMTVWGLHFRMWYVDNQSRVLQPLHGASDTIGTRDDYLYVDSEAALYGQHPDLQRRISDFINSGGNHPRMNRFGWFHFNAISRQIQLTPFAGTHES